MLTESLGSSQDSESSLHRSQYQNDVYVPQVEDPTRRRKPHIKSRSKRYKADQQPKENRTPPSAQPITASVDPLMVAAPSGSSSSHSPDSHAEVNRSTPRSRAFSLLFWKKKIQRGSTSVLSKKVVEREK